jgi:CHASE2 domain-containing sensor protein
MFGRGEIIDSHLTPVGKIGGAYVHANYVEALLAKQTLSPWEDLPSMAFEFFVSLSLAVVFGLRLGAAPRLILIFGMVAFVVLVAVFLWQNMGSFFDFFIPVLLLVGHAVFEQVRDWREKALKYEDAIVSGLIAHQEIL